jgi:hypothetical protein
MSDNTIVRYSGDWAIYNGAVAAGALLTVYNAGTSDLASIFTDNDLTVPSANPITADANGLLPFAWIGTSEYKVKLTTSGGTTIDEQDNISGALNTAPFLAGDFAKPDQDFNTKTANYTVVSGDLGTIINCDCSGGAFDITLISAVTATNGKGVTIRHTGTANTVGIVTVSSQTITSPTTGVTTTAFELISYGESVTIESDGANWHVTRYVPPLLRPNTPGVIKIADRVSAAPSSSPGTRYIVAAAFSTFEQEDIIEDNGQGGFIEITPPTDCGWIAYVQDEDLNYQFVGSAWTLLIPAASDTVSGRIEIAVQSEVEAASSTTLATPPGRVHFHPGVTKFWAYATVAAGTPTLQTSYNVTSIADTAEGVLTVTIATDFSSANWAPQLTVVSDGSDQIFPQIGSGGVAAGSVVAESYAGTGTADDPAAWSVSGLGDHA